MDPKVIASAIENPAGQVAADQVVADQAAAPAEDEKLSTSNQGTAADRTRLLSTLFTGYNKKVNPDNVVLKFGVTLIDFHVVSIKLKSKFINSFNSFWLDNFCFSHLKFSPNIFSVTNATSSTVTSG